MDSKVEINKIQKHFRSNFRWKYAKEVNKKTFDGEYSIRQSKLKISTTNESLPLWDRVILLKKKNY